MSRDPVTPPITAPINATLTPELLGAMNVIVVSFSCFSVISILVVVDENSSVVSDRSDFRVDSLVVPTDVDAVVYSVLFSKHCSP